MKYVKITYRSLLAAIAVYLLWPPSAQELPETSLESVLNRPVSDKAEVVIEFDPGNGYMPGTLPPTATGKLEGFLNVVKAFEARFPDTAVRFRQSSTGREWLVTQLSGGTAPDILNTNVENVWQDVHKGWYVPLDRFLDAPHPFVETEQPGSESWWDLFIYQAISRGKAAPDGKMYNLTYDMVETGILYNNTVLSLLGVSFPTTWSEMIAILGRIQENPFYKLAQDHSIVFPDDASGLADASKQYERPSLQMAFEQEGVLFPRTMPEWNTFRIIAERQTTIPMLTNEGSIADWGTDLLFDQLYYGILPGIDLKKDPIREQYLQGYLDWDEICFLNGKGFFTARDPRYRELYRILKEWRKYWNRTLSGGDQRGGIDLYKEFITQRGVFMWGTSGLVNRLQNDPDLAFDWQISYLPRFEAPEGVLDLLVDDYLATLPAEVNRPPVTFSSEMGRMSVDDFLRKVDQTSFPLPISPNTALYASGVEMCVIGGAATQYVVTNSAYNDTGDPSTSRKLQRVIQLLQFASLPEQADKVVNENPVNIPNVKGVPLTRGMAPFAEILERRYTTTKWMFTFDNRYNQVYRRMLLLYLEDGITLDEFMEWQTDNLSAAVQTIIRRKNLSFEGFEDQWMALEPVRNDMSGIPESE